MLIKGDYREDLIMQLNMLVFASQKMCYFAIQQLFKAMQIRKRNWHIRKS